MEMPCDHRIMPNDSFERSQRVCRALCSLVKGLEKDKNGYDAVNILRKEVEEPRCNQAAGELELQGGPRTP